MLIKETLRNIKLKPHNNINMILMLTLSLSLLCATCSAAIEHLANNPTNLVSSYSSTTLSTTFPSSSSSSALPASSSSLSFSSSTSSSTAGSSTTTSNYHNAGARTILRVYDECSRAEGGFVPCLKKKAILFIDRIAPIDAITVADGVKLVRLSSADSINLQPAYSENDVESSLPRSDIDRDTKLTDMLIERLSYFFNGHSLQVNFPKLTSDEIGRGLEEGRGKMKKMMGMMMMGMAMKMMGMIPIAMGMLYILAGKALIISKIALLLAGIIGLKKLISSKSSGGSSGWSSGGGGGGWSSGGGGGGGGWDRRSLNEAQELAYRAYSRQQLQKQQQLLQQHQQQQPLLQKQQPQQQHEQKTKIK